MATRQPLTYTELRHALEAPPEEPGLDVPGDPVLTGLNYALHAPVAGGVLQGALGVLGALGEAPVLGGVLGGLSYPGEVLRGVLLRHQLAGDVPVDGLSGTVASTIWGLRDLVGDTLQYGPLGALGHARDEYRALPLSGAGLVADAVLDPLNVVGFGAFGQLAKRAAPGRLRDLLGKAQAAEDAAKAGISAGFDRAQAALLTRARSLPGVGQLFERSARARVALENDRAVNFLGQLSALLGGEDAAPYVADLYRPRRVAGGVDTEHARTFAARQRFARALEERYGITVAPENVEATLYGLIQHVEPGFVQRFGPRLRQYVDYYQRDLGTVRQILKEHWPEGEPAPRTVAEAARVLGRLGRNEAAAELRQIADRWKGTDLLADSLDHAVVQRYLRRYAVEQGLGAPARLGDLPGIGPHLPEAVQAFEPGAAWRELLTAWRQQALFWPSYFINNWLDIETKSRIKLGTPGTVDLRHNLAGWAGKLAEENPGVRALLEAFGPGAARRATEASRTMGPVWQDFAERAGLGSWVPAELLQAGVKNELGGIKGPDLREPMGLERLPRIGRLFYWARALNEAIELSARSAAFIHGYTRAVQGRLEELETLLGGLMRHAGYDAEPLEAALRENDGLISPARLLEIARAQGADAKTQAQLLRELGRVQTEAYRAGIQEGFRIHFDYRDTTNLDELLRQVTGFHFWATRNVPLYFEIAATHPGLWASLRRLDEESTEYRRETGARSPRLEGTVPLGGLGRQLAQVLFGQAGDVYWDPRAAFALTQMPGSDVRAPSPGESALGRALDYLGAVGVSPHPVAQAALEIAGVYGARQPGAVLRATPLVNAAVQALTGQNFDLEAPIKTLRRQRLVGPAPGGPDALVRMRLRELSLEEYGVPDAPPYQRAQAEGPRNPLWQRAVRDLGNQALRERLTAALGIPLKLQPDAGLKPKKE